MEFLASLFVAKPLNILVVAVGFLAAYLVLRLTTLSFSRPLLIAFIAWGIYAAWEWLVQIKTPEANIRVDLLVIWPMLAFLSVWVLLRIFR
jgi:hypothetical protein